MQSYNSEGYFGIPSSKTINQRPKELLNIVISWFLTQLNTCSLSIVHIWESIGVALYWPDLMVVCSWLFILLENIIWNNVIFLRIDKTNRFHLFCDTLLIVYSVKLDLAVWKIEKELSFSERTQNAQNGNGKFKCVCFLLTGRHPKVWVSSTVKWCISLSSYFDVLRVSEWQDIWKEGVIKFNMPTATSQPK